MSYSVNWITKVISIPTADLTLVSGTRYSLDMADFLAEVRRLEWEPTEGLWAPPILYHTDTRYDFAGANYAPFDDMINDYTIQFTGVATRVDLLGSNNDIIDVLIPTGVSVVPSNSAGLQVVVSGSGITEQDKLDIANRVWIYATRSLTSFGTLIADIWSYITRTLTSGAPTKEEIRTEMDDNSTELAAIKAKTDNLPVDPAGVTDIPTAEENALELLDNQNAP